MAEVITVTDSTLDDVLASKKPTMLVFTQGGDLRSDFSTTLQRTAAQRDDIVFAKIIPSENPGAVERFKVGSKALLVGWFKGKEITRRSRPWGTDIPLAIEMLETAVKETVSQEIVEPESQSDVQKEQTQVDNKPVEVTDETFQSEAIDYSDNMPVMIDFWAEWCGPCRTVGPILEKLAGEFAGKIRIAKVDVDANPGLSQYFQIMSIPTIMILKNRTQIFSQPGAFPEEAFRDLIKQAIDLEVPEQPVPEQEQPAD